MKDEYLSIAEFAKRAGVTRQAVYKRLSGELSEFVHEVDGKKAINSKALQFFGVEPVNFESTHTFTDLATYFDKQNERLDRLIDVLEADNAKLYAELDVKNKQLLDSNERQRELSIMLDQQQKLNAQALLTGSQRDPDPSPVDNQEELDAAFDQGYQKGQADAKDKLQTEIDAAYRKGQIDIKMQLQAEIDGVKKEGRHEALTQYDLGYQKGRSDEQKEMAEIARALYRKFPDAADYLIEQFSQDSLD